MSKRVIARARQLLGAPFRLHGRDASGVDCIGVAAFAYRVDVPTGYALRTADPDAIIAQLRTLGFRPRRFRKPGDVVLLDAGPAQLHLGLWAGESLIHADAGLRRVVETPGDPRWPVLSIWRR